MRTRPSNHRLVVIVVVAAALVLAGVGFVLAANVATRPLTVELTTHIEIFARGDAGEWTQVDEVGPKTVQFQASLEEMASGERVETDYVFSAKTREGKDYSVRLAGPASVKAQLSGRFDADLTFEVNYDGASGRVRQRPTTESHGSPRGSLRGRRAKGVFGKAPSDMTLVSANTLRLGGRELLLVCEEKYTMTPQG